MRCGVRPEHGLSRDLRVAVHARQPSAHVPRRAVVLRRGVRVRRPLPSGLHRARVRRLEFGSDRSGRRHVTRVRRRGRDCSRPVVRGRPAERIGVPGGRIPVWQDTRRRASRIIRFGVPVGGTRVVGGCEHRLHDLPVARAPAEHAAERVEHFRLGRWAEAAEQGARGHEHARCADPALRGAVLVKRLLQTARHAVRRQSFHGGDRSVRDLPQRHEARADLFTVEENRARAAVSRVAADLGAGQSEIVAEHAAEACRRRSAGLDRLAVDAKAEAVGHGVVPQRQARVIRSL